MRKGFADLFIAQFNSLFYGVAFALIGWTIAFFYGASYGLTLTASSAFMLIAPVLALGLYALSHQIEQGETPRLRTTLTVWRGNMANIALYALVTGFAISQLAAMGQTESGRSKALGAGAGFAPPGVQRHRRAGGQAQRQGGQQGENQAHAVCKGCHG
jgi:uncharacterized membrane protein